MMWRFGIGFSVVLAACLCMPAFGEGAATQPATSPALVSAPKRADEYLTLEQLVQAYRQKQYGLLVLQSGRLLGNPKLRGSFDRFSVMVLRAESLLQMKNFAAAVTAFKEAAEEAPDEDKKALMGATAVLLLHRTGATYVPKFTDVYGNLSANAGAARGKPAPSIDLLDLSQRQNALRAVFWDAFCPLRQKIQRTQTMGDMKGVLTALREVSMLESAAGAQQTETKKLRGEVVTRAEGIMSGTVVWIEKQMKAEVKNSWEIEQVVAPSDPVVDRRGIDRGSSGASVLETRTKGFSSATMERIHGFTDFLDKVPNTVDELVDELHAERKLFDPLVEKAASTKQSIRDVVDAYSKAGLLR